MAYVPVAFILAGMTAYTVLAGADFGAGLWTLLAVGRLGVRAADTRRGQARDGAGVGGQPRLADLRAGGRLDGVPGRVRLDHLDAGRAAADRRDRDHLPRRRLRAAGRADESRLAEYLFALSSVLTPFALGTAVGAIAIGRVPVGNAAGNPVTSWLNPACVLIGALAVVFSGYLAAVYLAADSLRHAKAAAEDAGADGGRTLVRSRGRTAVMGRWRPPSGGGRWRPGWSAGRWRWRGCWSCGGPGLT